MSRKIKYDVDYKLQRFSLNLKEMIRHIKNIHPAAYSPISDLITYNPLPNKELRQIDPFIFLNHHGLQIYPPNNSGLPFGPHPHRGMETVTFILEGDILHMDSVGHESIIKSGGIQWMTAGKGLIHAEISSETFKKVGGNLEILQLWLNLPAKHKMTEPKYIGLQKDEINTFELDQGKVRVQLISGMWNGQKGSIQPLNPVFLSTVYMKQDGTFIKEIPKDENVFFYVVKGKVNTSGKEMSFRNLVEFQNEGQIIEVLAVEDTIILFGHAKPFNEPLISQGPFVMNSQQEIIQAYQDYQDGKFGTWKY